MKAKTASTPKATSTTQKYEGPDIASLLDRVRVEHGDDVKIVGANRCRSGGIAGFFAVESFEVLVEVPAVPRSGARRRGRRSADLPATGTEPSPSLAALIKAADEAEQRIAGRAAPRSVGAADFSAVLAQAVSSTPASPASPAAPIARRGEPMSPAGPFEEWRTSAAEDDTSGQPATRRGRAGRPRLGSVRKATTRSTKRSRRTQDAGERVIDLAALERAGLVPSLAPQPGPGDARRLTGFRRGDEVAVASLASLGVPPRWLAQQSDGHVSLASVLSNLTPPPPMVTGAGVTIAVVGELHLALDIARAVSNALRQDPDSCVLLSTGSRPEGFRGELVTVIDELADRSERWARRAQMTVVAIDIGFARHDVAWGRQAISSLRPAMRWGAVAATRKAEDVRAWAQGIGGLHALAVASMAETTTPAAILSAGVPVARIDGQMATHELWTRLLTERVADMSTRRTADLIAT